jgi:hypothetical protein
MADIDFGTGPDTNTGDTLTQALVKLQNRLAAITSPSVTLSALMVSNGSATVGAAYNGTISGRTTGSALSLTGAGAAGVSITGVTISGTPTTAGTINIVETLAGATNTPRTTSGVVTVAAATVTLTALTPSGGFQIGTATSGAIGGKTAGSTIVSNIPGITVTGNAYSGTPAGSAGAIANAFVETLAGAVGSPRSTAVTVAAAAATAPAAPSITLTPGNGQVSIAWTDGANGGAAITAHKLYAGASAGTLALVGTIATGSPYLDTGLTNGTAQFYALSAVNSVGEGAQSGVASATPVAGSSYDTDAQALFTRSATPFTNWEKRCASSLITLFKGNLNLWNQMTYFGIVGRDLPMSLLNWKNTGDGTITGTVTLQPSISLTGDGTTGLLNLNAALPVAATGYYGYLGTSDISNEGRDMATTTNSSFIITRRDSDSEVAYTASNGGFYDYTGGTTGFIIAGRSSGDSSTFINESNISIFGNGPGAFNGNFQALGGGGNFSIRPQGAFVVGGGFTQTVPKIISAATINYRSLLTTPRTASAGGTTMGIAANRGYEPLTTTGITAPYTFKTMHYASPQADTVSLRPIWVNWRHFADQFRLDGPSAITMEASIEYPAGTFTPLTFNSGSASVVIAPGALAYADSLPIVVPAGVKFHVRTLITALTGGSTMVGWSVGVPSAVGTTDGQASGNLKTSGVIGVGTSGVVYGPTAIMGILNAPDCRGYVLDGDSIAHGTGDTAGVGPKGGAGYTQRALDPLYPWAALTCPGTNIQNSTSGNDLRYYRKIVNAMNLLGGVSHVITEAGINDLSLGRSVANIEADYSAVYSLFPDSLIYPLTMGPYTSSTDGWTTTASQTPNTGGNQSQKPALNASVRSGRGRCAGYIEAGNLYSSGPDSGIWIAKSPAWTGDGLHPNTAGHAGIAAGMVIP